MASRLLILCCAPVYFFVLWIAFLLPGYALVLLPERMHATAATIWPWVAAVAAGLVTAWAMRAIWPRSACRRPPDHPRLRTGP